MSAQTPGPYRYHELWDKGHLCFIEVLAANPSGGISTTIHSVDVRCASDSYIEQAKSNARLIAAAPELLEALKRSHAELQSQAELHIGNRAISNRIDPQLIANARAIAKATGKEAA
ncbi:hypothetical protein P12x_005329 [Tundrisphaera lichenicola]|uniref:hypothetical protein n=1 Tax=Tundrisphaera lichenicola TaxID=2029860 RepID=UPI003EBB3C26